MPLFLNERDTESTEWMDDPDCDRQALMNTYRQFKTVNRLITGWKQIYEARLKPLFADKAINHTLLDIGFGGGDIPINLAKWAESDGINLSITAIETDPRAMEFVKRLTTPDNLNFVHCSSSELLTKGRQFDVVISNHLIHHLGSRELQQVLNETKQLSKKLVLFNDIERSDVGYALFSLLSRPIFRSSFITHDGLTSIKRSYTLQELRKQVPDKWTVQRRFPFRLILSYEHE